MLIEIQKGIMTTMNLIERGRAPSMASKYTTTIKIDQARAVLSVLSEIERAEIKDTTIRSTIELSTKVLALQMQADPIPLGYRIEIHEEEVVNLYRNLEEGLLQEEGAIKVTMTILEKGDPVPAAHPPLDRPLDQETGTAR